MSLRRKKQFALLNPVTKTRFEIGIIIKGQEPKGKLEAEKPNAMCSHKISISDVKDIDKEVFDWIEYDGDKYVVTLPKFHRRETVFYVGEA